MDNTTLVIVRNPDGSVTVSGPIGDKTFAYGMLEAAKDAIREYIDQQAKRAVIPVKEIQGSLRSV